MNKKLLLSLSLISFAVVHTEEPAADTLAYKVMKIENFVNYHHHFFNTIKNSIKIAAGAFTLYKLNAFHNNMFDYMTNEQDRFNNVYTTESQKIEPSKYFPWICKTVMASKTDEIGEEGKRKSTPGNLEIKGEKTILDFPSLPTAVLAGYLICSGTYGVSKELNHAFKKCMSYFSQSIEEANGEELTTN